MPRDLGKQKARPSNALPSIGAGQHRRKETNQMHSDRTRYEIAFADYAEWSGMDPRAAAMAAHPAGKGIAASDEVWDRETDEALALLRQHTPEVEPPSMRTVLAEGGVLALLILVMCFAEPLLGGLA